MSGPDFRRIYEAALGLAWLSQSGHHSLLGLLGREGPVDIWQASCTQLSEWGVSPVAASGFEAKRRCFCLRQAEEAMRAAGVRFAAYGTSDYPEELGHLRMPPAGLFVRGALEAFELLRAMPRVTIVGTRRATSYGVRATESFATAFATREIAVVSGMALGIDGRAHQAALDAGGLTVAVLGCGPDVIYPPRNRWLYEKIITSGVVVSELPPGTAPARWTFPHRNRILAALGDAVMVVEAPRASGALQTVTWALDLGRPVYSVPGSIYAENHQGCNLLLYDGAGPALDPCVTVEDFLLQTRIQRSERLPGNDHHHSGHAHKGHTLSGPGGRVACEKVLQALGSGPSSVDGLMAQTGLTVRELTAALARLELDGLVQRAGPGIYARAP